MKHPIPRTPQHADPARHKLSSGPDRPLTQQEIDRIMSEVYRFILSAGAARKAEEESEA